MRTSHKGFADSVLFALNIFIIILLLAGDSLAVPLWLQPLGRMHPLVLHFPIVILMLAMLMEYFRFNAAFVNEKLYQTFTDYLLVLGVIFSAITVIMGLFLSREPGYDGSLLQWHKWFGVSVVFAGSGLYFGRNTVRYNAAIAKVAAVVIVLCLIIAGHFGADLTHGEDFVLGPILKKEDDKVPIDKALVFKDVIEPIFKAKCISCHNPDKLKGSLLLSTTAGVLKGGKNGKLFVPGQPEISLLLQRVHLPEDDKKHMPPTGKPQLTDKEMLILYLWVKSHPDIKKKVIDLPATDSLRLLAATVLKPAESEEETYDFAAADEKDIKKLNNNYRVIYTLAQESPALAVNIYNKSTYNVKVLQELDPLKKQVVSLDMNKMPVKDADLKTIAQFENLRHLNLNFTDVTNNGLSALTGLKHLKTLSLAGTGINGGAVKALGGIKTLKELAVWGTGINDEQMAQLQKANKGLKLIQGFKDDGKPIKLNNPQLKNTSVIFDGSAELQLAHPIKGVQIRYTTDGTGPDSVKSSLYKPGIMLTQNTTIMARAYKAGWLGSDNVQFSFYKNTYTADSIRFSTPPDDKYKGDGPKTLIDKELGGTNFGNGKWIGSQKDVAVVMLFKKPVTAQSVALNTMRNIGSQIFLAQSIEVWGGADEQHLKLLGNLKVAPPKKDDPFGVVGLTCKLNTKQAVSCIKLIAKPLKVVPGWHPAKGKPGWVFIDEVFVN
ncbi:cytochrome C [Inquilinus sp. KBS0705]|nr:cytochrome C [Inquilinus sp. KBS0705]